VTDAEVKIAETFDTGSNLRELNAIQIRIPADLGIVRKMVVSIPVYHHAFAALQFRLNI